MGLWIQKNFQTINVEIGYFASFLQAEMVSSSALAVFIILQLVAKKNRQINQ